MKFTIKKGVRGMVKNLQTKYKRYDYETTHNMEFSEEERSFQYSQNGFIGFIRRGLKSSQDWVFVTKEEFVEKPRDWRFWK